MAQALSIHHENYSKKFGKPTATNVDYNYTTKSTPAEKSLHEEALKNNIQLIKLEAQNTKLKEEKGKLEGDLAKKTIAYETLVIKLKDLTEINGVVITNMGWETKDEAKLVRAEVRKAKTTIKDLTRQVQEKQEEIQEKTDAIRDWAVVPAAPPLNPAASPIGVTPVVGAPLL